MEMPSIRALADRRRAELGHFCFNIRSNEEGCWSLDLSQDFLVRYAGDESEGLQSDVMRILTSKRINGPKPIRAPRWPAIVGQSKELCHEHWASLGLLVHQRVKQSRYPSPLNVGPNCSG